TKDETQAWIDNTLGLTIGGKQSLVNLVVLTDNNAGCFLESDTATKRTMCESYFGLDVYGNYFKNSKTLCNAFKARVKDIGREYETCERDEEIADRRIFKAKEQETNWKTTKTSELNNLVTRVKAKQAEINSSDTGKQLLLYEEAQNRIAELNDKLPNLTKELEVAENIAKEDVAAINVLKPK